MDVRLWSVELIADLINLYKSHPCLWKVRSEEYKNRNLRNEAFRTLIDFCKARGFPEANRDFVMRKIQSLRGSFRKELKKVQDSERSARGAEEVYKPSLWYYDLLLFTTDQEESSVSVLNLDSTDVGKEGDSDEIEEEEEDRIEEKRRRTPVTFHPKFRPKKRKVSDPQADFMRLCTTALKANARSLNDFEAVGINLSGKLARMEPSQAIYAESLVSDIIRRGLLNQLTEETDFCENGCNKKGTWIHSHPSTSQSSLNEVHTFEQPTEEQPKTEPI
ncbi:uncharacterized protein LOC123308724 [Coccinella septempunctata]|uniref:uncharacterized protein LOC123308724 n=1 Tax=Coccinella septempunctata TaxID=41139 RepID=UPI001D08416E|nr:uncharacterized protein LOC123308724 [Coccinella septempunctata]